MAETNDTFSPQTEIELLDCTFRDGGYHTSWEFPHSIVQEYLYAMSDAEIRHIELGFRTQKTKSYKGATAFTTDAYIKTLYIPEDLRIGVMINASELATETLPEEVVDELFSEAADSSVSFVRIASQVSELTVASRAANRLGELGYSVALNVMQFTEATVSDLLCAIGAIPNESVKILYLADSLGRALPEDVELYFSAAREVWGGPLGFHGHDNRGFALANSRTAAQTGASWIDGTVSGIGRGAGNTQTQLLMGLFDRESSRPIRTTRLESLSRRYFDSLQSEKKWGPNYHYARAAAKGIHPTFVQELLENAAYSSSEISAAIDQLGVSDSARFEPRQLESIDKWLNQASSPKSGWKQSTLFSGKNVLFIGGGDSVTQHSTALTRLAKSQDLLVMVANLGTIISEEYIDVHVACNPLRLIADSQQYIRQESTLIAPRELVPPEHLEVFLRNGRLLDVGLSIEGEKYGGDEGLIFLPQPNVLAFGLVTALTGLASSVYLAGFDGYHEGDPRRKVEQGMLDNVLGLPFATKVEAITPTMLSLPQTSLYAL